MFDITINLGELLQIASMLGVGILIIWKLQIRLEVIDAKQINTIEKINGIEKELEKLTYVIIEQAKQNARLDHFESRIQELSNRIYDKKLVSS